MLNQIDIILYVSITLLVISIILHYFFPMKTKEKMTTQYYDVVEGFKANCFKPKDYISSKSMIPIESDVQYIDPKMIMRTIENDVLSASNDVSKKSIDVARRTIANTIKKENSAVKDIVGQNLQLVHEAGFPDPPPPPAQDGHNADQAAPVITGLLARKACPAWDSYMLEATSPGRDGYDGRDGPAGLDGMKPAPALDGYKYPVDHGTWAGKRNADTGKVDGTIGAYSGRGADVSQTHRETVPNRQGDDGFKFPDSGKRTVFPETNNNVIGFKGDPGKPPRDITSIVHEWTTDRDDTNFPARKGSKITFTIDGEWMSPNNGWPHKDNDYDPVSSNISSESFITMEGFYSAQGNKGDIGPAGSDRLITKTPYNTKLRVKCGLGCNATIYSVILGDYEWDGTTPVAGGRMTYNHVSKANTKIGFLHPPGGLPMWIVYGSNSGYLGAVSTLLNPPINGWATGTAANALGEPWGESYIMVVPLDDNDNEATGGILPATHVQLSEGGTVVSN